MPQKNGKVLTKIAYYCVKAALQAIIRGKVDLEIVIHSDGWRGRKWLIDLGYKKHSSVRYSNDEFARRKSHIHGIESDWSFPKTGLPQLHGVTH